MMKWKKIAAAILAVVMALAVLTACSDGGSAPADTSAGVALTKRVNELIAENGIEVEYSVALQNKAQIVANEVNNIPADKFNNANEQTQLILILEAMSEGVKKAGLVKGEDWSFLSAKTSEEQAKQLAQVIQQCNQAGETVTAVGVASMTAGDEKAISVVFQYTTTENN